MGIGPAEMKNMIRGSHPELSISRQCRRSPYRGRSRTGGRGINLVRAWSSDTPNSEVWVPAGGRNMVVYVGQWPDVKQRRDETIFHGWSDVMRQIAAQRHRVNRVMDFARANVGNVLNLDALADVACLSKFHFTRVFSAYTHETPMEYLQRTRLEFAANQLVFAPHKTITDIALDCGFLSSQSFSRSFHERFRTSARTFKATNPWSFKGFEKSNPFADQMYIPAPRPFELEHSAKSVRVAPQPEHRIAYIRHIGPYGDVEDSISRTFNRLQLWAKHTGLEQRNTTYIGVVSGSSYLTPARSCVYDAGIILHDEVPEDDTVSIRTIPAGIYAVLYVECVPAELNGNWMWLLSKWLPASGTTLAYGPSYELFSPGPNQPVRAEFGAKLYLRIAIASDA